jgi:hypothetical protein
MHADTTCAAKTRFDKTMPWRIFVATMAAMSIDAAVNVLAPYAGAVRFSAPLVLMLLLGFRLSFYIMEH